MFNKTLKPIFAISKVTFIELIRDKVLYNTLLFSAVLLSIGFFASKLMVTDPSRMILDFGYGAVQICCQIVALFLSGNLILKEFERRTVFLALSRPISRSQFLIGKYLGLVWLLVLNWALLVLAYVLILRQVSSDRFTLLFSQTLAWGLVFALFESLLVGVLTLMFSTFATVSLSVLYTVGMIMVGNNVSYLKYLAVRIENPAIKEILSGLSHIIPNFEFFQLGTKITYALPLAPGYVPQAIAYAFLQIAFFLFIASLLIHRKEA